MGCVGDEGLESPTLHPWTLSVRRELPGASGQQCVGTICQLHPRQLGVGVPLSEVHTPPLSLLPAPPSSVPPGSATWRKPHALLLE